MQNSGYLWVIGSWVHFLLFAYSDFLIMYHFFFKENIVGTFEKNKQMGSNFSEGFHLQKFLIIFLPIRAGWSKWILGQSKPSVPASWSSRIEGTERWLFLISAAPPWCWFGEAGWLDNAGISLAGGIPSTSVITWK